MNDLNHIKNKELFIALYFIYFILGFFSIFSFNFYNDLRILQVFLLIFFNIIFLIKKTVYSSWVDFVFILFIFFGCFYWVNYKFILFDLIVLYLSYRLFLFLDYNECIAKLILFFSFFIFLFFPISIYNLISTGDYINWYPNPWNIRVYNSYFLIMMIFSVWFFLKSKSGFLYLTFVYLAFLSILFDSARSVIVSFTVFLFLIIIFYKSKRVLLLFIYIFAWISYYLLMFFSNNVFLISNTVNRVDTSGRHQLWINAFECWKYNPFFGCGFYQIDGFRNLSAHPHNFFIQILTEIGIFGSIFFILIVTTILRVIDWKSRKCFFVLAALIAIIIDLSFSGIHIYPITQVALLWFFVFLLKNDDFVISVKTKERCCEIKNKKYKLFFLLLLLSIAYFFTIYIFEMDVNYNNFPTTPPRFWEYGYFI